MKNLDCSKHVIENVILVCQCFEHYENKISMYKKHRFLKHSLLARTEIATLSLSTSKSINYITNTNYL
jgi:hypothetical protein